VPVVHGKKPPLCCRCFERATTRFWPGRPASAGHDPFLARWRAGAVGFAKFTSDMRFLITPEFMELHLREGGRHLLTMRTARRGR